MSGKTKLTRREVFRGAGKVAVGIGVGGVIAVVGLPALPKSKPDTITWPQGNSPWMGNTLDKLYLQSGQFSALIKTSISVVRTDGGITRRRNHKSQ